MTSSNLRPSTLMVMGLISALTLSACASKPDRRGAPGGERSQSPFQPSGTFMRPTAALFASFDSNSDTQTSRAELRTGTQAEWARFERNPSAVNFASWSIRALGSTDAQPGFMSFDQDFNGVISQAEFTAQLEREFDRVDKNNDGKIERSELIIAVSPRQAGGRRGQGNGAREGGRSSGEGRGQGGGGQGGGRGPR